MARIVQTGFELQNIATEFSSTTVDGAATITIVTTNPRTGSAHLRVANASGGNRVYGDKTVPGNPSEFYFRMGLYIDTFTVGTVQNEIISFYDGVSDHINIALSTGRQILVYSGSTLRATDPTSLSTGIWHLIEGHFTIANSGIIQLRINGALTTNTTGDTLLGTGTTQINLVRFGEAEGVSTSTGKNVYVIYIDDFVLNNTSGARNNSWAGDGGIHLIVPSGAGNVTQLSRGGDDSGSNWSQVEEIPHDGTTTFVFSNSAGSADLYALANLPGGVNTSSIVNAVRWVAHGKQDVAGAGSIASYIRTNSTNYEGSSFLLNVSAGTFSEHFEIMGTNPVTGNAWTITELNSLEAGLMTR